MEHMGTVRILKLTHAQSFFVLAIGCKWIGHSPVRVYSNPTKADKDGFDAFAFPVCYQVCFVGGRGQQKLPRNLG